MTSILQSVSVLEAAEVLKIGFSPDKLLARTRFMKFFDLLIVFWGVGWDRPTHLCTETGYRMRWLQIFSDFALTCASNACMIAFHKSEASNLNNTFPPNTPPGWMAFLEIFIFIAYSCLSRQPHSQGQWKPSVCYLRCNRMVTRWSNVIGVDVGLVVGVRMITSVFLTLRDT